MNVWAGLGALITAAALGAAGAYRWQEVEIAQLKLEQANGRISRDRQNRINTETRMAKLRDAQDAGGKRAEDLDAVLDSSRTELDRVHRAADGAMRAASGSLEACVAHTNTQTRVFKECAGRLVEVGAAADGHVSDIQTLEESWP